MIGTSLRIGEVVNRDLDRDLQQTEDGMMLVIRENPDTGWRPKTKSSIRRVPLDERSVTALRAMYASESKPRTKRDGLNKEMRRLFPEDSRLFVHSCRHSHKTITRVVGMPYEFSDAISGHLKQTVSPTSDGYGKYPDSILIEHNKKVGLYLNELEASQKLS